MDPASPELTRLLAAADPSAAEDAWEDFLSEHSQLLVRATRSLDGDYDSSMDRYAFVLQQLRAEDFRRLRSYSCDGRTKFATWLVVVAKRLCIDHHRQRYGRPQSAKQVPDSPDPSAIARKRLANLIAQDVQRLPLKDVTTPDPEGGLIARETAAALEMAMEQLSNRDRLLLKLRFDDGASARQIAGLMGFPSQIHVYRRLNKLLRQLRVAMKERGFDQL